MFPKTQSRRKQYLELLGAHSTKELEEQVICSVEHALRGLPKSGPQVRLSTVARQFKIRPRPELIAGTHDGEIAFELPPGEFVIKLCTADPGSQLDPSPEPRMRFTYAHEFAHRFFYVESGEKWERALNVVTSNLDVAERMRHRISLRKAEEALCNRIARRLLIPDEFVAGNCPVADWLAQGDEFFSKLSTVAQSLNVSRDCLLVRLQDVLPQAASYCAFFVGYSKGPITQRGATKLRIISGLFPSRLRSGSFREFYPGAEWANFGESASDFVSGRLQAGRPVSSAVMIDLCNRRSKNKLVLRGWSRIIGPQSVLIWGEVT